MSKNPITGDEIKTKPSTKQYEDNYDRIFGNKTNENKQYSEYPVYFQTVSCFFGKEKKCKTSYFTPSKGYRTTKPDDDVITATLYAEDNTYWEYSMRDKNGIYKIVERRHWIQSD